MTASLSPTGTSDSNRCSVIWMLSPSDYLDGISVRYTFNVAFSLDGYYV